MPFSAKTGGGARLVRPRAQQAAFTRIVAQKDTAWRRVMKTTLTMTTTLQIVVTPQFIVFQAFTARIALPFAPRRVPNPTAAVMGIALLRCSPPLEGITRVLALTINRFGALTDIMESHANTIAQPPVRKHIAPMRDIAWRHL